MLLVCAVVFLCALAGHAQSERILDFHSDITLEEDTSLQVTETITVMAAGNQIRHGIYREFPTRYSDPFNNRYVVGFQVLSATRDSADESFRVEDYANGKRIYLGNANAFLPRGRHVYTLTYTTNASSVSVQTMMSSSGTSAASVGTSRSTKLPRPSICLPRLPPTR